MIDGIFSQKTDYFTSEFLKQCEHNPNVPQDISRETKYLIKNCSLGRIEFTGCEDPPFYSEDKCCEVTFN